MKFVYSAEQDDFASSLDRLLAGSDTVAAARGWADDEAGAGLAIWRRLAEQGVHALLVPEEHGGMGASPVEMTVAFEALGRYAVPGPWAESAVYLPLALGSGSVVESLAEGAMGTVAVSPHVPYALDADLADHVYVVTDSALTRASAGERHRSVDSTRRLFSLSPADGVPEAAGDLAHAFDLAVLATSAQLLGAGEQILADTVTYVKQRKQFGREIGSYQAIKHQLADVRIALDFARPLIQGAALADRDSLARDVSAAKLATATAAYRASRVGLQAHGAIGYTLEFDLSVWLTRVRALVAAWGTPAFHRDRILAALVATDGVGA